MDGVVLLGVERSGWWLVSICVDRIRRLL